jgi:hypothetical protein
VSARWAALLALAGFAGWGCGGGKDPEIRMEVRGVWNEYPGTIAQTGFQLWVDVGYPERRDSCFPLSPDLRVRVNDLEATPSFESDCQWDALTFFGPFDKNVPITVRWQDGDRVLGEAQFENLFPGADAQLVTPAEGNQVKVGEPFAATVPVPLDVPDLIAADFYWLDTPDDIPPYHTFVAGKLSDDGSTFQAPAPAVTGRAAVVLRTVFANSSILSAVSCTGFSFCDAWPDDETIGPFYVEVVP